jgi:hypothetical protein
LRGEVARDDGDALDPGGRELPKQRPENRASVDRQDRLRPALGDRAEPAALARSHHDGFHGGQAGATAVLTTK